MPQTISKIGIKNSSGIGYDTRDIGAKGQNVEVGYDALGKIILDVDTQTPTTTKQLTKVLQNTEKNISDLDDSKAPDNHAWSDADSGVNHGLADGTHYGHIKIGDGLTVNSGKVDVAYGNSANTACEGNDSRLSNARKNPNAITFTDGTTNMSYDGSEAKTVNATTIGAAPSGHTSVQATGSILGHVKTGTGIANNSGTISVSYGTTAGTACQGNDSRLSDSRTPKSHAATATTYGSGTSSNYGHVKLTDTYSVTTPNASTNGANTGIAASAYALQQAYNTLNSNTKHYYGFSGISTCNAIAAYYTEVLPKNGENMATIATAGLYAIEVKIRLPQPPTATTLAPTWIRISMDYGGFGNNYSSASFDEKIGWWEKESTFILDKFKMFSYVDFYYFNGSKVGKTIHPYILSDADYTFEMEWGIIGLGNNAKNR